MNLEIILHAGIATGTILLFAAIGEIFAERSGILNLGVEGMMLLGAMAGFSTSLATIIAVEVGFRNVFIFAAMAYCLPIVLIFTTRRKE